MHAMRGNLRLSVFSTFKRALVLAATASLASWVSPMQFFRFDSIAKSSVLAEDFDKYFRVEKFTDGLITALNIADSSRIPQTIADGSEIYGRKSTLSGDQLQIFETANISLSYLATYFETSAPAISKAISVDPASSRDTMVDFFAYAVRYWNHITRDFKPV